MRGAAWVRKIKREEKERKEKERLEKIEEMRQQYLERNSEKQAFHRRREISGRPCLWPFFMFIFTPWIVFWIFYYVRIFGTNFSTEDNSTMDDNEDEYIIEEVISMDVFHHNGDRIIHMDWRTKIMRVCPRG